MTSVTKCPICSGSLMHGHVTHKEEDENGLFYIFKNVPALICQACGEYLLADEVVEKLENLAKTAKPIKTIETPIYDYSQS